MLLFLTQILCSIGIHKWKQDREFHPADKSPSFSVHNTPERECLRCGKKMKWIHGRSDNETGYWKDISKSFNNTFHLK